MPLPSVGNSCAFTRVTLQRATMSRKISVYVDKVLHRCTNTKLSFIRREINEVFFHGDIDFSQHEHEYDDIRTHGGSVSICRSFRI